MAVGKNSVNAPGDQLAGRGSSAAKPSHEGCFPDAWDLGGTPRPAQERSPGPRGNLAACLLGGMGVGLGVGAGVGVGSGVAVCAIAGVGCGVGVGPGVGVLGGGVAVTTTIWGGLGV